MAGRQPHINPELKAHREWLGYLQPVGLVVAPAAILEADWIVTRSGSELLQWQERYREALIPLHGEDDVDESDVERGFLSLRDLLSHHLGWNPDDLDQSLEAIAAYSKDLPELGETLAPTAVVPAASGDGVQLLVVELPLQAAMDQKVATGNQLWRASAHERLERLLRETGVEAGLLFNGSHLRMVVAPKGESSGHLTFRLADLAEVSGRLMFSGLNLLLGQSHVFLDPDGRRLTDVLKKSRSFQAVVSNALADQVLAALWELLRGFQQADELSQRQDGELLGDLPDRDPQQLYGGLITVLMRLVFLLYAEDVALMPSDAVYEQNYKVSAIFEQLQEDASEYPDTMEQRFGAWAGLMSLCRLVFDGGGPTHDYLPARHGQLFDPDVYPWLETPWISDGVVLSVLRNLLIVNGERISYRMLDVEQIGSVYEGIMGYAVRRIPGRCIGLKSKPQGAKKQLTTAVDLDALLVLPGAKRKAWLEEEAGTTLPAKSATALKAADTEAELLEALAPRINRELFEGPQAAGSLVFQPTEERRRSGSHYTPRALTRPIVEEALRPWLERCEHKPTAAQILDLKICDPAMGSGAFLVESCRYLAELLEQAWTREGLPEALKPGGHALGEEPLIYARRLIAQSCLYGVDKNPFAVNLARLSLWLVSLSKDAPFTFVDHALKCGDSLVGMERSEIEKALKGASRQREIQMAYLDQVRQQEASSFALFHADSRSDADDAQKRQALKDLNASTAYLRTVGDLLVAAFFNGKKPKDREELKQLYLAATLQHSAAEKLEDELAEPLEHLRAGEKGIKPLHWDLAFPGVFTKENMGFDVIIGNPPFTGGTKLSLLFGEAYPVFLRENFVKTTGKGVDLVAFFLRRAWSLASPGGTISLIATKVMSEGDTRKAGVMQLLKSGGRIYSCQRRKPWPGSASVITSIAHLQKPPIHSNLQCTLDDKRVNGVNSYLMPTPIEPEPRVLAANKEGAFVGCQIYGEGFVFSNSTNPEKKEYAGGRHELERILLEHPSESDAIYDYLGGREITTDPCHLGYRKVINFKQLDLRVVRERYPALLQIVESKVKPVREAMGDYSVAERRKERWWQYGNYTPRYFAKIYRQGHVLAMSRTTAHIAIAVIPSRTVFSEQAIAFAPMQSIESDFALLQSQVHEIWALRFGITKGATPVYKPKECFETFPQPFDVRCPEGISKSLLFEQEAAGRQYHETRMSIMKANGIGLTAIYNQIGDPRNQSPDIERMRVASRALDERILASYKWQDMHAPTGYKLIKPEISTEVEVPSYVQEKLDADELFFLEANEALEFEELLRSCGAVSSKKNLAWRYRWPDAVRDDVLARLLALNAERYAEEVAQGLHSKGSSKASGTAAAGGKRRGRPAKTADSADTEQIGLAL